MHRGRLVVLVSTVSLVAGTGQVSAQLEEMRVRVLVEYIAGPNIYLSAGSSSGIVAGDTLLANRPGDGRQGRLRVISSAAERSVVVFVGSPFPVTRGDSLAIAVSKLNPVAPDRAVARTDSSAPLPTSANALLSDTRSTTSARQAPHRSSLPPRLDGTIAFDLAALDSETRWGDQPDDRTDRRFMTPAIRLHATLSNLPGEARVTTNLRYEYRYATGSTLGQTTALRVYQASIEKSFDRVPLQVRLGRFHNPIDLYGGYWDGASVRLGGRTVGIGAAAGFEPDRVNGGFSTEASKTSVFTDLMLRGETASWQVGLAAHRGTGLDGRIDRFVGQTQRLRIAGATLIQRVRLQAGDGWGDWTVGWLDVTTVIPLVGHLLARGHYARRSYDWQLLEADTARPNNERAAAGLFYSSAVLSFSGDASLTEWSDGRVTRTYSASAAVQRSPLAGLGFGVVVTHSESEDAVSDYVAPSVTRRFGRSVASFTYQLYRAEGRSAMDYEAASLTLSVPVPGAMHASLRAQTQWGDQTSSNRIFTTLWKAF